jgi:hypothetical protein
MSPKVLPVFLQPLPPRAKPSEEPSTLLVSDHRAQERTQAGAGDTAQIDAIDAELAEIAAAEAAAAEAEAAAVAETELVTAAARTAAAAAEVAAAAAETAAEIVEAQAHDANEAEEVSEAASAQGTESTGYGSGDFESALEESGESGRHDSSDMTPLETALPTTRATGDGTHPGSDGTPQRDGARALELGVAAPAESAAAAIPGSASDERVASDASDAEQSAAEAESGGYAPSQVVQKTTRVGDLQVQIDSPNGQTPADPHGAAAVLASDDSDYGSGDDFASGGEQSAAGSRPPSAAVRAAPEPLPSAAARPQLAVCRRLPPLTTLCPFTPPRSQVVRWACAADEPGDLALVAGERVEILDDSGGPAGWWRGRAADGPAGRREGYFPANFVERLPPTPGAPGGEALGRVSPTPLGRQLSLDTSAELVERRGAAEAEAEAAAAAALLHTLGRAAASELALEREPEPEVRLGRIVALHYRSSTSYQMHRENGCLFR